MSAKYLTRARRSFTAIAVAATIGAVPIGTTTARAYDEASTSALNLDKAGVALRGYDPVAYFTVGTPTKGLAQFSAGHDGAVFHFASAANRDAFAKEPAKYAPAFGGFCAMGAALDKKLDGDPNVWKIVGGKLYLNVGAPAQKRWQEDIPGNISKAEQKWPKIRDKAPKDL